MPKTSTDTVDVFAGHININGECLVVEFHAPKNASTEQKDAAFMSALAQKAEVDYICVGSL